MLTRKPGSEHAFLAYFYGVYGVRWKHRQAGLAVRIIWGTVRLWGNDDGSVDEFYLAFVNVCYERDIVIIHWLLRVYNSLLLMPK